MIPDGTVRQQPPGPSRLGPLLGHVTERSARAFIRLRPGASGPVMASSRPFDHGVPGVDTAVVELPPWPRSDDTFVGDVPLRGGPGTVHEICVTAGGVEAGRLHARAAEPPSSEGRIAFGFGSCWKVDSPGRPEATWEMIEALARARVVDHLLLLGDQIYADETPLPSRPGSTASSLAHALGPGSPLGDRAAGFREAYQRAWDVPALQRTLAMLPVASTWDDHEIANGFGSESAHRSPAWQAVFEPAAAAFDEFQGSRNPAPLHPESRAWAFRRGPAAFVGLDLRTHRARTDGILLGDAQRRAVGDWIEGPAREARVLFVACSVPPLHLPRPQRPLHRWIDINDQWDMTSESDRGWLLQRIRDFEDGGRRRAILLGGDAHLATVVTLRDSSGRATWQLTSSPLSQRFPAIGIPALSLLGTCFRVSTESGERLDASIQSRFRGPNLGIVHGTVSRDRIELAFELQRPGRRPIAMQLDAQID